MGSAYKFLKNSGLIDLSNYTGVEVSQIGHDYCKKNYPNVNWIHKRFYKNGVISENMITHLKEMGYIICLIRLGSTKKC